jgi:hypothetical protein
MGQSGDGIMSGRRVAEWLHTASHVAILLSYGCAARTDNTRYDLAYRIEEYLELRSLAAQQVGSLSPASSAGTLRQQADKLATTIQRLRQGLGQGVILAPETARAIKKRLAQRLSKPDGPQLWRALEEVQPAPFAVVVNERYPETEPRESMPPSLLAVLPPLPSELSYRFVGRDLVLLDRNTSLIVDIVTDALPRPPS